MVAQPHHTLFRDKKKCDIEVWRFGENTNAQVKKTDSRFQDYDIKEQTECTSEACVAAWDSGGRGTDECIAQRTFLGNHSAITSCICKNP